MQHLQYEIEFNNTQYVVADSILHKLKEYWKIIDNTTIVATVLDPRTKCSTFTSEENTRAIDIIKKKMNDYAQSNNNISNGNNNTIVVRQPDQSQSFNRLDAH